MRLTRSSFSATAGLVVTPILVLATIALLGTAFYLRGREMMERTVKDSLRTTAAVSALQFDDTLIRQVQEKEDMQTDAFEDLVRRLDAIRDASPGIRFAYVMRRTGDPNTLSFVADADTFASADELDRNGNGKVDLDEAPGSPGDEYDISEVPELQGPAFEHPTVDEDFTVDQWGTLISGYAPIRNRRGQTVAVLGLDMEASEFARLSVSIFSPIALLLVLLGAVLIALSVAHVIVSRRAEARRQLETERSALLDLASHQLGTPLATFKWWLEILRERGPKAVDPQEICEQMQHGVDRMDAIIAALRNVGHAETGLHVSSVVEPLALVRSVVQQLQPFADDKRISIVVRADESLPRVEVDPKLFAGAIGELLQNAIDYSPERSAILIDVRRKMRGLRIKIRDHGHGIPDADMPHIFERFRRGGNAMRLKPVGNGLGLSIVKGIIERAGGTIWVDSKEGNGTAFTVDLPSA